VERVPVSVWKQPVSCGSARTASDHEKEKCSVRNLRSTRRSRMRPRDRVSQKRRNSTRHVRLLTSCFMHCKWMYLPAPHTAHTGTRPAVHAAACVSLSTEGLRRVGSEDQCCLGEWALLLWWRAVLLARVGGVNRVAKRRCHLLHRCGHALLAVAQRLNAASDVCVREHAGAERG
jgi:hypothetical protein